MSDFVEVVNQTSRFFEVSFQLGKVVTALGVDVVELWCTTNEVLSVNTATNGGTPR